MKTKLLVEICDLEQGQRLIENKVGALLLNVKGVTYTKQFNCYTNELSILVEKAQENNVELFVHLDMLYHEDDLIGLRAILKKLNSIGIKNLVICDIGVIELANDLNLDFKFINGGSVLNTNYATIDFTNDFYSGFFLSNEINIDEVVTIAKKTSADLFVQVFGKQKIFTSKRKLLTSYCEYNEIENLDMHPRNKLIIKDAATQDNYSYIYEDQFGTYIYTMNNVNALSYLDNLIENDVKYLYLNNLFCDLEEYDEVINIFNKYLKDNNYSIQDAQNDLKIVSDKLSESFFNDETVFTIEQAKLLEMELKDE
ncbi:collagenase-like PrtC family protease [Bacilli bacterium PM5-9]|nr:collagenase-like PrtC family protease [Bacilli bacterium PM5-9]